MLQRLAGIGRNRYVLAVVTGGLAGIILLLFFLLMRGQRDTIILQVQPVSDPLAVQVYVGGEVSSPGLYSLRRGSRVADAVTLAGGLLPAADTATIGMAAMLEDADQIFVPARRPTPQPAAQVIPIATPLPVASDATALPELPTQLPPEESGPVDINTAPIDVLDRLPGIGPVIAGRIVEYRLAHGPFQTLEELEQVAGISMRMVEELRPLVTLGS
jgi:competence protein ComEA